MKYLPGSEKIEWEIPAEVLLDPEKNKKLMEETDSEVLKGE